MSSKCSCPPPSLFSVAFDIPLDSQFFKQTTSDGLYDVYTIVGQNGSGNYSTSNPNPTFADKTVNATFTVKNISRTIYYVCVGGGGYSSIGTSYGIGGGGAGAYYEGSFDISLNVNFQIIAGGSYKMSTITSSLGNVTSGYGGKVDSSGVGAGNNGSSGGGGRGSNATATPAGLGSPPGNNGGSGYKSSTSTNQAGGGGGGAGGAGGDASSGNGGTPRLGKVPTSPGIKDIYTNALCVGGPGGGYTQNGNESATYGSGAKAARLNTGYYRYGPPGAIIIAIPKT